MYMYRNVFYTKKRVVWVWENVEKVELKRGLLEAEKQVWAR